MKNIIAPPKIKSPPLVNDKANKDEISSPVSSVNGEKKLKSNTGEPMVDSETTYAQSEDGSVRSPSDSPAGRSSLESASQLFHSPRFSQNGHSPRLKEGQRYLCAHIFLSLLPESDCFFKSHHFHSCHTFCRNQIDSLSSYSHMTPIYFLLYSVLLFYFIPVAFQVSSP